MTELIEDIPKADQATATHELAHAFAGREMGLLPGKLYVHRWMGGGKCFIKSDKKMATELWVRAQGVVCAAGREGEAMWRERCGLSTPWSWGCGDDYGQLREIAAYEGRSVDSYVTQARQILETVWGELELLIEPLARKGYLPGLRAR